MVVTRQSNHRDTGETGEDSHLEPPPNIHRASPVFQPPMSFVFAPPNQNNTSEEFDIPDETDSIQCDSEPEPKDTASEMTEIARRSDVSPSRGGSEVVRLLASLHDLSRQMEVTMSDLRAQLGQQMGSQTWPAGDYDLPEATYPRERPSERRIKQIKMVVSHTWRGVVARLLMVWQLVCMKYPAVTNRLTDLGQKIKPFLPALGYILLAHVMYSVYTTHQRLLEQQRRRSVPWL